MYASNAIDTLNLQNLDGKSQGTRKNPHVIDAGLELGMPVNCWCIIVMAIYTIPELPT